MPARLDAHRRPDAQRGPLHPHESGLQMQKVREGRIQMNVQRAKEIIRNDTPSGNVFERIEALKVAQSILGDDATMGDIWRWAEHDTDTTEAVNEE